MHTSTCMYEYAVTPAVSLVATPRFPPMCAQLLGNLPYTACSRLKQKSVCLSPPPLLLCCTHIHVHVYAHTHAQICTHTCTRVHECACTCTSRPLHTHTHAYMQNVHAHAQAGVCMHTQHMHACMHTHRCEAKATYT